MAVSASLVRDLREKTSAGMLDCKKALEETSGDFEAAVEWLRKKGLSSAAKKADRLAAEGLVAAQVTNGKVGVLLEVNSETDFVARNEQFQKFVKDLAGFISNGATAVDVPSLMSQSLQGQKIEDLLKQTIATIGENLVVRRFLT